MKTLAINQDNDIYVLGKKLVFADGIKCQQVILDSLVRTQRGEVQLDDTIGVDYFGTVFTNHTLIELWAAEVQTAVKSLEWVKSIKKFDYKYDSKTNTLHWAIRLVNQDDQEVSLGYSNDEGSTVVNTNRDWNAIKNKPSLIGDSIRIFKAMRDAAQRTSELKSKDTWKDTREAINGGIIEPLKSI